MQQEGRWIVRRLAPDCSRVELSARPKVCDEVKLLYAMGFETANIHLGSKGTRKRIPAAIKKLPAHWLYDATEVMMAATIKDWKAWKKG